MDRCKAADRTKRGRSLSPLVSAVVRRGDSHHSFRSSIVRMLNILTAKIGFFLHVNGTGIIKIDRI